MQRRPLGNTGEMVSLLGAGGFHLLEIGAADVARLLGRYLDAGGNYIETAAGYGDGQSEDKIGRAVGRRRGDFLLATKTHLRDRDGALAHLERSLRLLRTDRVDIWFMHNVPDEATAEQLLAPGGALEAAEQAKREGKVRFIGATSHGLPRGLLSLLCRCPVDAVMTQVNYYDAVNFPQVAGEVIPLARQIGAAIIAMKPLADGYLWRSAEHALRYAWSQPVSLAVAGFNSAEMLERDLAAAEAFAPMTPAEVEELLATAPEFRGYVCRQCAGCPVEDDLPVRRIFELEGWYDRQMWDGIMTNPEDYALRMRLGGWYGHNQLARDTYAAEALALDPDADYTHLNLRCLHGLDINRKLKIAHAKLTGAGT